jgi:filamentous hemagglutinin
LVDVLSLGGAGTAIAGKLVAVGLVSATPTLSKLLDQTATNALLKSGGAIDATTGQSVLDMGKLTNAQKGVIGDLFGQNTVKQIVPDGQKIARMPGVGETGIDDLYKVSRPDLDYIAVEYKFVGSDGKTGANALGMTADGLQGSSSWTLAQTDLRKR